MFGSPRLLVRTLAAIAVTLLLASSVMAQARTPANRRPQMPPRPPIFPATNGRPAAFQNGHGAFGNVQSSATGAAGQAGQAGQGGGFGGAGGAGAFGGAGGGLGAFGQFGNGGLFGGGLGGLAGGMKGFSVGGGLVSKDPAYQNGVGLYGGSPALGSSERELELARREPSAPARKSHRLLLAPAIVAAIED